jgi:hypothetical protein
MANSVSATITNATQARFQSGQAFSTTFFGVPKVEWVRQFTTTDITKCYFASLSVSTTPTSVDLTSLTDAYGTSIAFSSVKHLRVVNTSAVGNLTVGGGTNGLFTTLPFTLNGSTGSNNSDNGSDLSLTTPITVDGTHKILTLTASAGTIVVSLFVLGT